MASRHAHSALLPRGIGQRPVAAGRLVALAVLLGATPLASGSNWAQITGSSRQNLVVPKGAPFSRRWGFAAAVLQPPDAWTKPAVDFIDDSGAKLLVMGGEDFHSNSTGVTNFYAPNLNPNDPNWIVPGGGTFRNDVWRTSGARYRSSYDALRRDKFHEVTPLTVSETSWTELGDVASGRHVPPANVPYREWICCMDGMKWFPCARPDLCEREYIPDATLQTPMSFKRWSPRRSHKAVTVQGEQGTYLLVMGGRARALEHLPVDQAIGGLTYLEPDGGWASGYMRRGLSPPDEGPPPNVWSWSAAGLDGFFGDNAEYKPVMYLPPNPRADRELSILTSDVWMSLDGLAWNLMNGGCYAHQEDLAPERATPSLHCATDDDCFARGLGDAKCNPRGVCVCRHWSPRERFGAAADNGMVFVAGGITATPGQLCGYETCKGSYTRVLSDVWASADLGVTWTQMTPLGSDGRDPDGGAPWRPRSGFAFVAALNKLWVFGGRGHDPYDPTRNPLLNDVWWSGDSGATWFLNGTDPDTDYDAAVAAGKAALALLYDEDEEAAFPGHTATTPSRYMRISPWAPRADHQVVVDRTRFVLMGGQVRLQLPPPPPPADPALQVDKAVEALETNRFRPVAPATAAPLPMDRTLGDPVQTVNDVWVVETATYTEIASTERAVKGMELYTRDMSRDLEPGQWYRDLDWGTLSGTYINPYIDSLRKLFKAVSDRPMLKRLKAVGVETVADLAGLSKDVIQALQNSDDATSRNICYHVRRAQIILGKCTPKTLEYDGAFMKTLQYVDASTRLADEPVIDDGCTGDADPGPIDGDDYTVVCQQRFSPRHSFGAVYLNGAIYVIGGYEAPNVFAEDVWYRDARAPTTYIVDRPRDKTDDVIFSFRADEPYCRFMYRIMSLETSTPELVRDWTWVPNPWNSYNLARDGRRYRLEVIAVDPAGNRDDTIVAPRNVHIWAYEAPFPWLILILILVFLLLLCLTLFYIYRRYRRRKALQRYLERRKLRKIRGNLERYEEKLETGVEPPKPVVEDSDDEDALAAARKPGDIPPVDPMRFGFGRSRDKFAKRMGVEQVSEAAAGLNGSMGSGLGSQGFAYVKDTRGLATKSMVPRYTKTRGKTAVAEAAAAAEANVAAAAGGGAGAEGAAAATAKAPPAPPGGSGLVSLFRGGLKKAQEAVVDFANAPTAAEKAAAARKAKSEGPGDRGSTGFKSRGRGAEPAGAAAAPPVQMIGGVVLPPMRSKSAEPTPTISTGVAIDNSVARTRAQAAKEAALNAKAVKERQEQALLGFLDRMGAGKRVKGIPMNVGPAINPGGLPAPIPEPRVAVTPGGAAPKRLQAGDQAAMLPMVVGKAATLTSPDVGPAALRKPRKAVDTSVKPLVPNTNIKTADGRTVATADLRLKPESLGLLEKNTLFSAVNKMMEQTTGVGRAPPPPTNPAGRKGPDATRVPLGYTGGTVSGAANKPAPALAITGSTNTIERLAQSLPRPAVSATPGALASAARAKPGADPTGGAGGLPGQVGSPAKGGAPVGAPGMGGAGAKKPVPLPLVGPPGGPGRGPASPSPPPPRKR